MANISVDGWRGVLNLYENKILPPVLRRLWKEQSGYDPLHDANKIKRYWNIQNNQIKNLERIRNVGLTVAAFAFFFATSWTIEHMPLHGWKEHIVLFSPIVLGTVLLIVCGSRLSFWKKLQSTYDHDALERAGAFARSLTMVANWFEVDYGTLCLIQQPELRQRARQVIVQAALAVKRCQKKEPYHGWGNELALLEKDMKTRFDLFKHQFGLISRNTGFGPFYKEAEVLLASEV